jgi:ATP-binding protein involved in chromosome partitioning
MTTQMPRTETILDALSAIPAPGGTGNLVSEGMIKGLRVEGGEAFFMIEVNPESGPALEPLRQKAETCVQNLPGIRKVSAVLTAEKKSTEKTAPAPQKAAGIETISHIVAIASGKGGVGKSTVAANLAIALSLAGLKTGLMDADVYGPSVPRLMGITGAKPEGGNEKKLSPLNVYNIKVMSMGFLVPEETPMIWRGPMVSSAIQQLLQDVEWGALDVLVVDMPPGTGDAQLSLAQRVPLSGAVIVSTPQDIALIDARKGLEMFRKVDVPVFGMIENMSTFICPHCGGESHIFGHDGAKKEAQRLGCDFLGALPLHASIRQTSDLGTPITIAQPQSPHAAAFIEIAKKIAGKLGPKRAPPRIVME